MNSRSQRPHGLRRASEAARLLGLGSNSTEVWIFVSCDCCVLSGTGLCVGLITRPEGPTDCGMSTECNHEAPYGEAMTRIRVEVPRVFLHTDFS